MKTKKRNNEMKILGFLAIAMLALFIFGIEGCSKGKETQYNGLVTEFVENAPMATMVANQKMPIYADVKNMGEANIQNGNAKFYLEGIGNNLDGVETKLSNKDFLDKKTGTERLYFAREATTSLQLKDDYTFPIVLVSCYKYGTLVESKVCVAKQDSSVCKISGEKIDEKSNTDAPVKVTSLTESVVGNKLVVTFAVENKGLVEGGVLGQPYLKDADCDILEQKSHKNYIDEILKEGKVNVRVDAEGFKCTPENEVSLKAAGKANVVCEKTIDSEDYQTLFKIVLDYKYKDAITKTLTIVKA